MAYSCIYPTGYTLTSDEQARYPVGKRFTSMALWEAQNLSLTEDEVCEIIGGDASANWGAVGADTSAVVIAGWVTNGFTITIRAIGAARPENGIWSDAAYRLATSVWSGKALANQVNGVFVDDLQITHTGGGADASGVYCVGYYMILDRCLFRRQNTASGMGVRLRGPSGGPVSIVKNSIAFGGWSLGFDVDGSSSTITAEGRNCTSYGNATGFKSEFYTARFLNCLASGGTACFVRGSASYQLELINCASSDGTADDFAGSNNRVNQTPVFVDPAGFDFHIDGTDTSCRGYGIGPEANASVPITDIDGDTRSGMTTDIGADLYVADTGVITAQVTDALAISGGAGASAILSGTVSDTFGMADDSDRIAVMTAAISDAISLSGVALSIQNSSGTVSDHVILNGQTSASAVLAAILSETLSVDGASASSTCVTGSVFENLGISDSAKFGARIQALVSDMMGVSSGMSASATFFAVADDALSVSTALSAMARFTAILSERLNLHDITMDTTASVDGVITISISGRGNSISFRLTSPKITIDKK